MRVHKFLFGTFLFAAFLAAAAACQELALEKTSRTATSFVGERLVYKIEWDPPWYFLLWPRMEAGEAQLQLIGDSEYNGRKALKIEFKGHSSGTLSKVVRMKIEDEFVFYVDPQTFCTIAASSKIREGKRKRQVDIQYLGESRQLHIREVDESLTPPKVRKDETKDNIPECVHDPFAALYLFRQAELSPQFTRTFQLANDDKIKEVKAFVERKENIQNTSGKASVWKIGVTSLMGGLFKEGGQFKIWLSADEQKIPVQFEVKVKLGRIFGTLK